jgi:hypothetical protein
MAVDAGLYERFTANPRQVMSENRMPENEIHDVLEALRTRNAQKLAQAIDATGPVSCSVPTD